ncbi:hypothetical protein PROFUN_09240, partial [Planoprotostelium fungivorum]
VPLSSQLLSGMRQLTTLFLGNCQLGNEIDSISSTATLTHLDISGNKITQIPESFRGLMELQRLDISHNSIEDIGEDILEGMIYLQEIILSNNPITLKNLIELPFLSTLMDRGVVCYLDILPLEKNYAEVPPTIEKNEERRYAYTEMTGKRPTQEDALLIEENFTYTTPEGETKKVQLWGVFDGHAGSSASKFGVKKYPKALRKQLEEGKEGLEALDGAFQEVNRGFREAMDANELPPMERHCGSTGLALIVDREKRKLYCANVGDTRAVLSRGGKAIRLSYDHKPGDEEDRINELGGHVVGEVTRRVNGVIAVSRAIGDFYMAPFVTCECHLAEFDITEEDDHLILGCDGVWDEIGDQKAVDIISSGSNLYDSSVRLRDAAYLLSSEDNISVITVSLQ